MTGLIRLTRLTRSASPARSGAARLFGDPLLRRRSTTEPELMDDPDCDPVALERTYRLFALINPLVSGWRGLYRRRLREALRDAVEQRGTASILDIGSGGGDVSRWLADRARRDGLPVTVTGIDPDPRAHEFAQRSMPRAPQAAGEPAAAFRCASSTDLLAQGEVFDVVVSNHVLHHLDDAAAAALLADTRALCRGLAVHNDLRRSRAAWLGWWLLTLPLAGARTFVRFDGLLSIRRSRTIAELTELAGPDDAAGHGWQAQRHGLFRAMLTRRA